MASAPVSKASMFPKHLPSRSFAHARPGHPRRQIAKYLDALEAALVKLILRHQPTKPPKQKGSADWQEFFAEKWSADAFKARWRLPASAPARVRDAQCCLAKLDDLRRARDIGDADGTIWEAIAMGQFLTQIDARKFEDDLGKRAASLLGLASGTYARQLKAEQKRKAARAELQKRLREQPNRNKSKLLAAMAKENTWGGLRQLQNYCRDINRQNQTPPR